MLKPVNQFENWGLCCFVPFHFVTQTQNFMEVQQKITGAARSSSTFFALYVNCYSQKQLNVLLDFSKLTGTFEAVSNAARPAYIMDEGAEHVAPEVI